MEPVLVESPIVSPGRCIDGRQDGPVVDTLIQPLHYGRVYLSRQMLRDCTRLCRDVVEELAGEIGWVPVDVYTETLSERDVRIAELELRMAELEPVERALARAVQLHGDTELDDEPIRQTGRRPAGASR